MLLSNCSKLKDDLFGAIYWGIRAYACTNYYPMKENILKFLEESRIAYLNMLEKDWVEAKNSELFKYFVLSFLRFLNIILTKIGFEELSTVSNNMFEYLERYIHYLINEGKNKDNSKELTLFQQVVILVIFSLYSSIQGYNPRDEDANKFLNPSEKKFSELAGDDLAKECLKYSYAILYHIFELVLTSFSDETINIIMPLLYYAAEHKSVFDYLTTTYKNLKDKLIKFNEKIKTVIESELAKVSKTKEEILVLSQESLYSSDKILLGYIPIMLYVHKRDIFMKKIVDENLQFVCKLVTLETILDNLGCFNISKDQKSNTLFDMKELDENISDETKKQITNFGLGLNSKEKKIIVIDGQNVAIRYGDTKFCSMGLKLAIECFKEKGHEVHVVLPDYYFNKEEVALKRELAVFFNHFLNCKKSRDEGMKHIPDDVDLLIQLKNKGYAFGVPNWEYDDSFIIEFAKKKNAYIVTNDRYNDHIEKYSKNDQGKRRRLKEWMRSNCISFTFIGKEFIPNPDFMNTNMK